MIHGGDIYSNGFFKNKILLDYSSNINPLGVPKSFTNNINEAIENLNKYPDIQYRVVKENLSKYCDINKEYFVVGNGAAELLDLSISNLKSAVLVVPSFGEYEDSLKKWNIPYDYLKLKEEHKKDKIYEYKIDYKELIEVFSNNHGLIIANPNNPNGSIIDKKSFIDVLDYAEKNAKIIIVDEAFIEFVCNDKVSLRDLINNYKCLFIVRALTKFFAMPGIRFGYGFSSNIDFLEEIKHKQNPWNVNTFAELAVKYCLSDNIYINNSYSWINKEREIFIHKLTKIEFISKVYYTNGNFVLVKLKDPIDCDFLYYKLLEQDILIRKANNYIGLDKSYVRFAIKDTKNNEKFLRILTNIKGSEV